ARATRARRGSPRIRSRPRRRPSRQCPAEPPEGEERPDDPVQVVADQEIAREPRSREVLLVPVAVLALCLAEPRRCAPRHLGLSFPGGHEPEERPGGLRRRRDAPAPPRLLGL